MFAQFQEQRNADYAGHLNATLQDEGGKELQKWLRKNARPCPQCHVIVSRSQGCDEMGCVCGCRFCYKCGRKSCKCGQRKRRNIWDVRRSKAAAA